jgi:ATP-binding cassette, subfamily B, bacterial
LQDTTSSPKPKKSIREQASLLLTNGWWALTWCWKTAPLILVGSIFLTLIYSAVPALQALVIRQVVNAVVDAIAIGDESAFQILIVPWLIIGFVVTLVRELVMRARQYMNKRLQDELFLKTTVKVFEHTTKLELKIFEDVTYQDMMARAQQNIALHVFLFVDNVLAVITNVLQMVSLVAILLLIDPITVFMLMPIVIPYIIFHWRESRLRYDHVFERAIKYRWTAYFTGVLVDRVSVPEVKLSRIAPTIIKRYETMIADFLGEDRMLITRKLRGDAVFSVVFTIFFYIAFTAVVLRAVQGIITVGDIAIYGGAVSNLRFALEGISASISGAMEKILYITNLTDFLAIPASHERDDATEVDHITGDIRFENVNFTYPNTRRIILDNLSFHIPAGQIVALVGENAAGKTTLVKLLARLYDDYEGQILVDGIDTQLIRRDSLYNHLTVAMQTFNRYEATAHDNIAYGDWHNLKDDRETVQYVAEQIGINDMIEGFPEKYDQMLGRMFGGIDLSGGQWQKLAVARALARQSAKIIVLDEPTSALDAHAEYRIFRNFRELAKGRTTILISHRFSTLKMADRVLMLEHGKIVEDGTHDELISLGGAYARLYESHLKQNAIATSNE